MKITAFRQSPETQPILFTQAFISPSPSLSLTSLHVYLSMPFHIQPNTEPQVPGMTTDPPFINNNEPTPFPAQNSLNNNRQTNCHTSCATYPKHAHQKTPTPNHQTNRQDRTLGVAKVLRSLANFLLHSFPPWFRNLGLLFGDLGFLTHG